MKTKARNPKQIYFFLCLLFCIVQLACKDRTGGDKIDLNTTAIDTTKSEFFLFSSIDRPLNDRLLLFDRKYYLWLNENPTDSSLTLIYGKFLIKEDSILFRPADSTVMRNTYYCFCPDRYENKNNFQFKVNEMEYDIGETDYIFKKMFFRKKNIRSANILTGYFRGVFRYNELTIDNTNYKLVKE